MTRKKSTKFDKRRFKKTYFALAREKTEGDILYRWDLYKKIAFFQLKQYQIVFTTIEKKTINHVCNHWMENRLAIGDPLSAISGIFWWFCRIVLFMKINAQIFSDYFGVNPHHLRVKAKGIDRNYIKINTEVSTYRKELFFFQNNTHRCTCDDCGGINYLHPITITNHKRIQSTKDKVNSALRKLDKK